MTFRILSALAFLLLSSVTLLAQTVDVDEGCAPLPTAFTAPAGSSSYYWDFGDGAFSTLANPGHIYVQTGDFTVSFSESPGGPVLGTIDISVYEKPTVDIDYDPVSGCLPLTVDFTDNTTLDPAIPLSSVQWSFGDGTISVQGNPTHTYTTAGTFTVSLEVNTGFGTCDVTEIFENIITAAPSPPVAFSTNPNPPAACTAPLTVEFTNDSPGGADLTYAWDFGNGNTSDLINPPAQTYTEEGTFTASLTITNSEGCAGTETRTISIGAPSSEFNLPDTVCLDILYTVSGVPGAGFYEWDFGDNASMPGSTMFLDTVRFIEPGLTTVSLTASNGDCSSTTEREIFVQYIDPLPVADPPFSCFQPIDVIFTPTVTEGIVSYSWEFQEEFQFVEAPTFTYEYPDNNPYTIYEEKNPPLIWVIETDAGCVFTDTVFTDLFTVHEPTAYFNATVVDGCAPLTVTLQDTSRIEGEIVSWEWDWGDGTTESNTDGADVTHTYDEPGEYEAWLIVENAMGCIDTSYFQPILVGEQIDIDFAVDVTEICPGDSVTFTPLTTDPNIDEWQYTTDDGRSWHCYQENEATWTFTTETGIYDAELTVGYNGCFSTVTQENLIEVKGPIARIEYVHDCATPYTYEFTDVKYESGNLVWDFGDGNTSTELSPVHTYAERGDYQVRLTVDDPTTGCAPSADSVMVFVREIIAEFTLDSTLCSGSAIALNGGDSQDVFADCHRGYTWFPPSQRPITTSLDSIPYVVVGTGDLEYGLEVRDINGCLDTAYVTARHFNVTSAFSASDYRICFPDTVAFTDFSSGDTTIVEWSWDFGEGGTSDASEPIYIFDQAPTDGNDTLLVTFTVRDAVGCPATSTQFVTYYEPFSNIFTAPNPPALCAGDEVTFIATNFTQEGSFLLYDWDFANGETSENQSEIVTYPDPGDYQITLNVTEAATGCPGAEVTYDLEVQAFPIADFSSSVDDLEIICYPEIIMFQDESESFGQQLNYFWQFGNGQTGTGSSPSASFDKGTFTVIQNISTTHGCTAQAMQTYTLVGPEGEIILDTDEVCNLGEITVALQDTVDVSSFSWDFGDGNTADNVNPVTHQYNVSATVNTFVSLILRGENDACTHVETADIAVIQIVPDFSFADNDSTFCTDDQIALLNASDPPANTFMWMTEDGQTSEAADPVFTAQAAGELEVTLTASYEPLGCTETITRSVIVSPPPAPVPLGTNVCEGEDAELSIENPDPEGVYIWTYAGNEATGPVVTFENPQDNTNVSLSAVNAEGCEAVVNTELIVTDSLNGFTFDSVTCPESEFEPGILQPSADYNYMWNGDPALSCTDCPVTTLMTPATGEAQYTLTATDPLGACPPAIYIFNVSVLDDVIEIPNVFTPNGDGVNDFFNYVQVGDGEAEIEIISFEIYNRWGQKVYDNTTPDTGWDGTHGGKTAVADVYAFVIKLAFAGGGCELPVMKGDLSLVR